MFERDGLHGQVVSPEQHQRGATQRGKYGRAEQRRDSQSDEPCHHPMLGRRRGGPESHRRYESPASASAPVRPFHPCDDSRIKRQVMERKPIGRMSCTTQTGMP